MDEVTIKGAEAFYDALIKRLTFDAVDPLREGVKRHISDMAAEIMSELREEVEENENEKLEVIHG
jgi:hypothetical protein